MDDVRDDAALAMHRVHAAKAQRCRRAAVIGIAAADDDAPLRLAFQVPEMAHHAQDRVVGLRARIGEEDMVEMGGRQVRQQRRQLRRRRRRGLEEGVVERQLHHLLGRGADQLAPAVTDVHAPQPGHPVEITVAVRVPQVDAVGMCDDPAAALRRELLVVSERVQVMRQILFDQRLGVVVPDLADLRIFAHGWDLRREWQRTGRAGRSGSWCRMALYPARVVRTIILFDFSIRYISFEFGHRETGLGYLKIVLV